MLYYNLKTLVFISIESLMAASTSTFTFHLNLINFEATSLGWQNISTTTRRQGIYPWSNCSWSEPHPIYNPMGFCKHPKHNLNRPMHTPNYTKHSIGSQSNKRHIALMPLFSKVPHKAGLILLGLLFLLYFVKFF